MEQSVKTHKRKSKNLVDPGDLVSEKSLEKVYSILGRVIFHHFYILTFTVTVNQMKNISENFY